MMRFLVSPDGVDGTWFHHLDLTTGLYPKYSGWLDCTEMDDAQFEACVLTLQRVKLEELIMALPEHAKAREREIERMDTGICTKHLLCLLLGIEYVEATESQKEVWFKSAGHIAADIIGNGCRPARK